jgi:fatty acid desaturase
MPVCKKKARAMAGTSSTCEKLQLQPRRNAITAAAEGPHHGEAVAPAVADPLLRVRWVQRWGRTTQSVAATTPDITRADATSRAHGQLRPTTPGWQQRRDMTSVTTTSTPRRNRAATDYSELLRSVQSLGLLDRRYGYYAVKIASVMTVFAGLWVAFVLLGESWGQLGIALVLGLVLTHVAFLSHDAAHRQVFRSSSANEWLATCLSGAVLGMSATWWVRKHTRHHANPNQVGKDPDIKPTVIAFYPEPERERSRLVAFLLARQGWWFFPILTLEGLNLHAQSVKTLVGRSTAKRRWVELSLMAARWACYLAALFWLLPAGMACAFLAVQLATFGLYMGCTFAPSHKGMPILPEDAKIDFLRRQVLMSRNITGPELMTFAMGGLNYQVEHHLFPSMPRPNLRRAKAVVEPYCKEHGVSYSETSLWSAYRIVVRYLNKVGLGARDPFQCPLVASYRPRG